MTARHTIAIVLLTVFAAASTAAAPGDLGAGVVVPDRSATDGPALDKELDDAARKDLNSRYAKVLATELGLLKSIDKLDAKLEDSERRLLALGARRAGAMDSLRDAEDDRAGAEKALQHMRGAVRARLRAIARLRRTAGLRFAISSKDHRDGVIKQRVLVKLLAGDRERLRVYRARLAELAAITDRRNAALANVEALDADLHAEKAKLERERHDLQALIRQARTDPLYGERVRRDFNAANKAMAERIATFKQWQERRYTFGLTRKRLLRPVNYSDIEVPFGPVRDPTFGTTTMHRGVDIRPMWPERNNPVRAVFWARVAFVGRIPGYGRTVILDHGKGWHSIYGHLKDVLVKVGDVVRSRARLGMVGSSGSLKGPYLYFEIRENGEPRNPNEWFR